MVTIGLAMASRLQRISSWRAREASKPPTALGVRSSSTFIVATICIAVFTDIFLYGCIVPVIPFSLKIRVGVPQEDVQHWVSVLLAVYGAALLAGSPISGWLADKTPNRRLPLLIGLLALAGATLLLCLGNTLALLLLGRVLQGFSAAIVWTVGLALLADTVGHESIGQAVGYVSISMSMAILLAPLLGGIAYDRAGYYSVYYMAFGMIILDIILRLLLVEKKVARRWADVETPPGRQSEKVSEPDEINLPATETPHSEQAAPSQLGNATKLLLSSRRLWAALFCTIIQAMLLTAWDAVLPLYVNKLFGWHSIGGGLILLPLILPSFLAPLVGIWTDRKGPKWPCVIGFLFAIPFLILLRLVDHDGIRQIVLLCALLALVGLASSNAMTPLLAEIAYVVNHKEQTHPGAFGGRGAYATAYGLFNTAFAGGMLAGPLWSGLVTQKAGWGTMCWTLALPSALAALVAWLFVGGTAWKVKQGTSDEEV